MHTPTRTQIHWIHKLSTRFYNAMRASKSIRLRYYEDCSVITSTHTVQRKPPCKVPVITSPSLFLNPPLWGHCSLLRLWGRCSYTLVFCRILFYLSHELIWCLSITSFVYLLFSSCHLRLRLPPPVCFVGRCLLGYCCPYTPY